MKNPLRSTSFVFAVLSFMYLVLLILFAKESDSVESFIQRRIVMIVGLCFCIVFFGGFFKKSIIAWWAAMIYFPAIVATNLIIGHDASDAKKIATVGVLFILWSFYLFTKYDPYEKYLIDRKNKQKDDPLKIGEKLNSIHNENAHDPQNPLQVIFYFSFISAVVTLFYVVTGGGVLARKFGRLAAYSQHVITLLFILSFVLCYQKKASGRGG